ncbi:MAG: class I SAM-dependent methyltransferase [Desulfobacteraceae bacterium]|jgi:ubiquinone/menaquinone biosynthesis C-methylase UbiE
MKQAALFHPRVFDDVVWAKGYYRRNARNIHRVGRRFAALLKVDGFEGGRILDSGCGFGAVALELALAFPQAEILGVDLGDALLERARSLAEKAGVASRITFRKGDVHRLDLEDNAFDLVVNTFMLHIVEDPVSMLNEMERVTRPDGRILITDLRRIWLATVTRKLKTALTLEEALAIIQESSLRPGKAHRGPFWWDYRIGMEE